MIISQKCFSGATQFCKWKLVVLIFASFKLFFTFFNSVVFLHFQCFYVKQFCFLFCFFHLKASPAAHYVSINVPQNAKKRGVKWVGSNSILQLLRLFQTMHYGKIFYLLPVLNHWYLLLIYGWHCTYCSLLQCYIFWYFSDLGTVLN